MAEHALIAKSIGALRAGSKGLEFCSRTRHFITKSIMAMRRSAAQFGNDSIIENTVAAIQISSRLNAALLGTQQSKSDAWGYFKAMAVKFSCGPWRTCVGRSCMQMLPHSNGPGHKDCRARVADQPRNDPGRSRPGWWGWQRARGAVE